MSSRLIQIQTQDVYSSRSSSPHRRKQQTSHKYSQRAPSSSNPSTSSSAGSSASSSNSGYGDASVSYYTTDAPQPHVEVLRCSRCAKCVETVSSGYGSGVGGVSAADASASGMVQFGHNLYYCDRCARMVGYK